MMEYVTRINLKTCCLDRRELIDFCLHGDEQYLAIGWSHVHGANKGGPALDTYSDYYYAVKNSVKRINPVLNIFWSAGEDDLFWTRDLDGCYWICRATAPAQPYYDGRMDIGAVLPVEAYPAGLEVPGQIKASFNRPRAGTAESIKSEYITEYSKYMYNLKAGKPVYAYQRIEGGFLNNLPDLELEELVIAYLQLKEDYYVLSNSIANKSTTVKIECELISRDRGNPRKAVVQVKGGNSIELDARDYLEFAENGYTVYLFAPRVIYAESVGGVIVITKEMLCAFYEEYKSILPSSITKWENLFAGGD